jgi:riboflavin kinase/FMN adenylyltransferase
VGENFRFGKGAKGTEQLLRAHSEFETHVTPLVEVAGETVSSTQIRGLVAAGEVRQAAAFLGRPFLFEGQVVEGDRRGRELGMPTANLVPDDRLVTPGHGVYAAWAHLMPSPAHPAEPGASGYPSPAHRAEPGASGHPAAVNVGVRPTFATGRGLLVEAHLIGFAGDIYGQTLRIAFLERMRGERAFESVDALVAQMNRDVEQARDITERTSYRVA